MTQRLGAPIRRVVAVAGLGAAMFVAASMGSTAVAGDSTSLHGTFRETATGSTLGYNISGSAKVTVGAAATSATVNVAGLDPEKEYGSHLHNGTCANGGGGHYQHVEGGATTPPNELWLSTSADPLGHLEPNPGGGVQAAGESAWAARLTSNQTNARSIIVHEPGGARIACADLR